MKFYRCLDGVLIHLDPEKDWYKIKGVSALDVYLSYDEIAEMGREKLLYRKDPL
jgi:hypothetical protein